MKPGKADTVFVGIGAIASGLGGFGFTWAVARGLGVAGTGIVLTLVTWFTLLAGVTKLGMDTTLVREGGRIRAAEGESGARALVPWTILPPILLSAALGLGIAISAPWLGPLVLPGSPVPLTTLFAEHPMVLVKLSLLAADGTSVSENFYWRGRDEDAYRQLDTLAPAALTASAESGPPEGADRVVRVTLANDTAVPALNAKLTLVDGKGDRILPAFYDDNYVSLLPGERRTIAIRYPASAAGAGRLTLAGWNVPRTVVDVAGGAARP